MSAHTPQDQMHQEKMMILNQLIKSPTALTRDTSPHFSWRQNTRSRVTHFQQRQKRLQAQHNITNGPQLWKSSENRPNNFARRLLVASQPQTKFLSGAKSDLNDDLELTIQNNEEEGDNRYMGSPVNSDPDEKHRQKELRMQKQRRLVEKQKIQLDRNPMRDRADKMIHHLRDQNKKKNISAQ